MYEERFPQKETDFAGKYDCIISNIKVYSII